MNLSNRFYYLKSIMLFYINLVHIINNTFINVGVLKALVNNKVSFYAYLLCVINNYYFFPLLCVTFTQGFSTIFQFSIHTINMSRVQFQNITENIKNTPPMEYIKCIECIQMY